MSTIPFALGTSSSPDADVGASIPFTVSPTTPSTSTDHLDDEKNQKNVVNSNNNVHFHFPGPLLEEHTEPMVNLVSTIIKQFPQGIAAPADVSSNAASGSFGPPGEVILKHSIPVEEKASGSSRLPSPAAPLLRSNGSLPAENAADLQPVTTQRNELSQPTTPTDRTPMTNTLPPRETPWPGGTREDRGKGQCYLRDVGQKELKLANATPDHIRTYMSELDSVVEAVLAIPLWDLSPNLNLPISDRGRQTALGNIGFINISGGFTTLFNIFEDMDANHRMGYRPPPFFKPFEHPRFNPDDPGHVRSQKTVTKLWYGSPGMRPVDNNDPNTIVAFQASRNKSHGAVLVIPDRLAIHSTLGRAITTDLKIYLDTQAFYWYEWQNDSRQTPLPPGSLLIVSDCLKTQSWAAAVVQKNQGIVLKRPKADSEAPYWELNGFNRSKFGPLPGEMEPGFNQCVAIVVNSICFGECPGNNTNCAEINPAAFRRSHSRFRSSRSIQSVRSVASSMYSAMLKPLSRRGG